MCPHHDTHRLAVSTPARAMRAPWWWCALWAFGAAAAHAGEPRAIFLIEDASEPEVIHLSDSPAAHGGRASLVVAAAAVAPRRLPAPPGEPRARARDGFSEIVASAAASQRLEPALIHAVIGVESGYAPHAVSPRGALGLMQLMPATAKDYGVTDAFDPRQNVLAGARHLRALLDEFGQDMTLALAAYNAGSANVRRHGRRIPPFGETARYVPDVLARLGMLRRQGALASSLPLSTSGPASGT